MGGFSQGPVSEIGASRGHDGLVDCGQALFSEASRTAHWPFGSLKQDCVSLKQGRQMIKKKQYGRDCAVFRCSHCSKSQEIDDRILFRKSFGSLPKSCIDKSSYVCSSRASPSYFLMSALVCTSIQPTYSSKRRSQCVSASKNIFFYEIFGTSTMRVLTRETISNHAV